MTINRNGLLRRYDTYFGAGSGKKLVESKKYFKDVYIRVNLSKTNTDDVERFLNMSRVKYKKTYIPNAFRIEKSHFSLASSLLALKGHIYIQDIASQIPVNCIDFENFKGKTKKIRVLDCCAAPGSKTTQLADILTFHGIEYEIIALEPETKRLTKLINNIQKSSFENIKVKNVRAQDFKNEKKFDIVLVDAPCSGNIVGDRDWLLKRDLDGILLKAKEQKEILKNVAQMVAKNGILIYSTCSIEPEEDEDNVKWFEQNFSEFSLYSPKIKFPFDTTPIKKQKSIRLLPYKSKSQGFFVACFVKR